MSHDILKYTFMKYRLSKEEFNSIYSRVPRLCVEVIYYMPQKGVLLTRRAIEPAKGMWHTPGGTVYYKETMEDAVRRIAERELGMNVIVDQFLGIIEFNKDETHVVSVAMLVKSANEIINLNEEASEYAFFRALPENMIPAQKEFLLKHLNLQ